MPTQSGRRARSRRFIASIVVAASVVDSTNIVRNRNQTISRPSSVAPERNDETRSAVAPAFARCASFGAASPDEVADASGARAGPAPSLQPPTPAATQSAAATHAVPPTPTLGTKSSSAPSAPATAPRVFQPYAHPRAAPKPRPALVSAAASSGSVAPIAVAGIKEDEESRRRSERCWLARRFRPSRRGPPWCL